MTGVEKIRNKALSIKASANWPLKEPPLDPDDVIALCNEVEKQERIIEGLKGERDHFKNQELSQAAMLSRPEPHPWYGPCDGIADGECSECQRCRRDAVLAQSDSDYVRGEQLVWRCLNCKAHAKVESIFEEPKGSFETYIRGDGGEILTVHHDCGKGTKGLCERMTHESFLESLGYELGDYDDFLGMGPDEVAIVEARSFADKFGQVFARRGWSNSDVKEFFRETFPRLVDKSRPRVTPPNRNQGENAQNASA